MKKHENISKEAVLITIERACELSSLGTSTVRKLAADCGAVRKIGRAYRINREQFLNYVDSFEL